MENIFYQKPTIPNYETLQFDHKSTLHRMSIHIFAIFHQFQLKLFKI